MKSVEQHLADLRGLLGPGTASSVAVLDAFGLALDVDVLATTDLPTFASSAMDGYAVRVADVPGTLEVVGEVAAGAVPRTAVGAGQAVRVMTGSPLPAGTEAVVMVEDTRLLPAAPGGGPGGGGPGESGPGGGGALERVEVSVGTHAGRHLRAAGEDLRAGQVVLRAGTVVGAAQLAALLAAGRTTVEVRSRTRVAVLSTGDELVDAGTAAGPAQLVDSNGPGLAAAARAAGAEVVFVGRSGDEPTALLAALDALPECDLVVTSGGVSMGAYDVVKAALAPLGVTFESVAIQPGKPQAWGRYRGGPALLGLPGNPVSALVCFELFGRAVLGRERPVLAATLADPVERTAPGRRQYLRGRLERGAARVVSGPASHLLAGLARADCLVVVPEEATALPAGSVVDVIPLGPDG